MCVLSRAEVDLLSGLKRGDIAPGPDDVAFGRAFEEAFGVAPLAAWEGSIAAPAPKGRRPRLTVVLERRREAEKFRDSTMRFDRSKQERTAAIVGREKGELFVAFTDFETCAVRDAHLALTPGELDEWAGGLGLDAGLWRVNRLAGAPVVFTHTAEQAAAVTPERLAEWSASYLALARRHDEFGYLTPEAALVRVDSKENLDANFAGSWYYYWL